jgi:hypothetical protein
MLAIVAALVFALPGALGLGRGTDTASAQPVLSNGYGDVCWVGANAGNQVATTNPNLMKVQVPVGLHFDVLARTQDSFHLALVLTEAGGIVTPVLNPLSLPNVDPLFLSASIDGHDGEAKIVDRIEDHNLDLTTIQLNYRFPFIPFTGMNWQWPVAGGAGFQLAVVFMFGDASENDISPVNTVNALDVLMELAGGGGDIDPFNSDIQEFFVNRAAMRSATDETVAKGALINCGLPLLSGSSKITASNMQTVWLDMIYCFVGGDAGACTDLDTLLSLGAVPVNVNINMDGWSQISVECFKPGQVKVTFDPTTWMDWQGYFPPSHKEGKSLDIECIGSADNATASASPTTVEIAPVGDSDSLSTITVTVTDHNGRRLDGASVTFSTDRCRLGTSSSGPFSTSPVTAVSDTDTTGDKNFLSANGAPGGELGAGTAEAYLQCDVSGATPGTATVTWVVEGGLTGTGSAQTGGQTLSGTVTVKVVGPPSTLALVVSPATSTCGTPVVATATVKDAVGQNVSDGTLVFFTTTTATGTQGGSEGAQGGVTTVGGVATVTLSVDPTVAGTHTVSARTGGTDLSGDAVVVVSQSTTFSCTVVAAAPATVTAPKTGQGPTIVPPSTGDAGLASSSSSSLGFFAIGVVVLALASVASFRFARR